MGRGFLRSVLALAVLSPGLLPYSPGVVSRDCLCTEQACCRPSRPTSSPTLCHGQARPTAHEVLRCAHGTHGWPLQVATVAAPPERVTVMPAAAGTRAVESAVPGTRDGFALPFAPPPRSLAL